MQCRVAFVVLGLNIGPGLEKTRHTFVPAVRGTYPQRGPSFVVQAVDPIESGPAQHTLKRIHVLGTRSLVDRHGVRMGAQNIVQNLIRRTTHARHVAHRVAKNVLFVKIASKLHQQLCNVPSALAQRKMHGPLALVVLLGDRRPRAILKQIHNRVEIAVPRSNTKRGFVFLVLGIQIATGLVEHLENLRESFGRGLVHGGPLVVKAFVRRAPFLEQLVHLVKIALSCCNQQRNVLEKQQLFGFLVAREARHHVRHKTVLALGALAALVVQHDADAVNRIHKGGMMQRDVAVDVVCIGIRPMLKQHQTGLCSARISRVLQRRGPGLVANVDVRRSTRIENELETWTRAAERGHVHGLGAFFVAGIPVCALLEQHLDCLKVSAVASKMQGSIPN
eukprot:comp22378_c0_seq1/m.54228 comp22378_c0_seq1/g.54228  ORF comp22378_c0_seq1/g.54228 comp22378_c0_seq1/m.54228 type:complete len:392 (+) comp22378_c0_seq1:2836-4011(+)